MQSNAQDVTTTVKFALRILEKNPVRSETGQDLDSDPKPTEN
jgi:hypothetical protein